ncbi:MAG: SDR family oxidoreductase [Holophagales bacterium]|nr:SDR family oxidoreductase [Holophagales bacterium]
MRLDGKVALVTGGAHGIGKALCERFAAEGAAAVAVADIDLDAARGVCSRVLELGSRASALDCDVSQEGPIRDAVARTEAELGPVDLLVSNAGLGYGDGPGWMASSQSDEQWNTLWRVNVMAHVWGARAVLPGMIRRGGGYVLATVSAAGLLTQVGDAAYATTKHAAIGFAESLAITHGEQGIGVSVLCPQGVRTRLLDTDEVVAGSVGADGILEPEQVADAVIEGLDAERFLILPHPPTLEYLRRKTADYDRWLAGMRRFRRRFFPTDDPMDLGG